MMNASFSGSNFGLPTGLMVILWVTWWIVVLVVLWNLLARKDMEPVAKFMWVFVVISVPLFGVIFYWTSPATKPGSLENSSD